MKVKHRRCEKEMEKTNRLNLTIPAAFKYVTTRKDKACEGCQKIIPKGAHVLNVHGRVGFWFNEYWCKDCDLDRICSIPDQKLRDKILRERKGES